MGNLIRSLKFAIWLYFPNYLAMYARRSNLSAKACLTTLLFAAAQVVFAEDILVAVASNFSSTAEQVAERFELETGHEVRLAFGSTAHHYAQIVNGAPFDVFLAADDVRPELLEASGRAIAGSRFTYAYGRLVLWSNEIGFAKQENITEIGSYKYLSIANPRVAPYGLAAMEALSNLDLLELVQDKIVRGENVTQAFQFVETGAAQLGFVSLAQIKNINDERAGSYWLVDTNLYSPIRQQAVLLSDKQAAKDFMQYLGSAEVGQMIQRAGYGLE